MTILIVEDREEKYIDILDAMAPFMKDQNDHTWVRSAVEAYNCLKNRSWDLLILDISIDINIGRTGNARGGHANLGGLDIIEFLYLFEIELPTIIVTGFDYFEAARSDERMAELVGLEEICTAAIKHIGDNFLGAVRYQDDEWRKDMRKILEEGYRK